MKRILILGLVLTPIAARADVKMPALFGDNMVLQRGAAVPIWGEAAPGEKVTVKIFNQSKEATASATGRQEIVRITIDPQAMTDKAMLEDLIAAACNQALAQTKGFVQEEIQKVVSQLGLPLPPGFDLSKLF